MQDHKGELAKSKLPNTIINNICKYHDEECQDCKTLRRLPKINEREKIQVKKIAGLTFLFVRSHIEKRVQLFI